ncbi:MAG: hypothetical protein ABGW78_08010 [Pirellulales bacterium]
MGTNKQKKTISQIRDDLERRLFTGRGDAYIAWYHAEDRAANYKFSKASRPPQVPIGTDPLKLVSPLRQHQAGNHHGLSIDGRTTHLPLLGVDMDRHSASICPVQHLEECKVITTMLVTDYRDFFVQGEVNPRNGSAKAFMLPCDGQPIYIKKARDIAGELNDRIKEMIGRRIEIFPDNLKNLWLPCRDDKTTIIDTGYLPRNSERYCMGEKVLTKDGWATEEELWALANQTPNPKRFMNEVKGYGKKKHRVHYESYDYRAWAEFLQRGQNLDTDLFFAEIERSCLNLPYQEEVERVNDLPLKSFGSHGDEEANIPHSASLRCGMRPTAEPSNRLSFKPTVKEDQFAVVVPKKQSKPKKLRLPPLDEMREEPNSYTRQFQFCLLICQKEKRVVEVDEALSQIREHSMFTGDWCDNEGSRERRVELILSYIARTFDPDMLGSGTTMDIDFDRWMKWARGKFTDQRRVAVSYSDGCVFEDGTVRLASNYQRYCRFNPDEICGGYAIISYCMKTSLLEDGGVPEDRAEAIWEIFHEAKVLKSKWNVVKFRNIRDMLHKLDIIKCDYVKRPGKAYCYSAGKFNPEQPTWKSKVKRLRTAGTASSYIYKRRELNTVGVYYTSDFRENSVKCLFGTRQRPPP